jgi:hypothetical protein
MPRLLRHGLQRVMGAGGWGLDPLVPEQDNVQQLGCLLQELGWVELVQLWACGLCPHR